MINCKIYTKFQTTNNYIKIYNFIKFDLTFEYILLQVFCGVFYNSLEMNILKWISKYTIIIVIGVLLAMFVARIQYDTTDLSASVLSLTEQDFFESTKRDAGYKKENQIFEIFLAEQVRNEWLLTVSILYAPNNIELFTDQIDTKYLVNIIEQNEGNLILNVYWYENWDFTEWIFELPYNWDSKDITLEYIQSQNSNFAIWNLDNIENYQNH